VDAAIVWGDGAITYVTTPGPHTHVYGNDGVYTVLVHGSVGAYNSYVYGGMSPYNEEAKLVSVDSWGGLGFTSMHHAFFQCSNLVTVPATSDGLEAVTDMSSMFSSAKSFNGAIGGWDTSSVTDMAAMFYRAKAFNQDLSGWCVTKIRSKPPLFDDDAAIESYPEKLPVWGTCP
jgi:surface protein